MHIHQDIMINIFVKKCIMQQIMNYELIHILCIHSVTNIIQI